MSAWKTTQGLSFNGSLPPSMPHCAFTSKEKTQCFKNIILLCFFILHVWICVTWNPEFRKHLYISLNTSPLVDFLKCLPLQPNLNGRKSLLYFQTLWVISGYNQKARIDGKNTCIQIYCYSIQTLDYMCVTSHLHIPPPSPIRYTTWQPNVTLTFSFDI